MLTSAYATSATSVSHASHKGRSTFWCQTHLVGRQMSWSIYSNWKILPSLKFEAFRPQRPKMEVASLLPGLGLLQPQFFRKYSLCKGPTLILLTFCSRINGCPTNGLDSYAWLGLAFLEQKPSGVKWLKHNQQLIIDRNYLDFCHPIAQRCVQQYEGFLK